MRTSQKSPRASCHLYPRTGLYGEIAWIAGNCCVRWARQRLLPARCRHLVKLSMLDLHAASDIRHCSKRRIDVRKPQRRVCAIVLRPRPPRKRGWRFAQQAPGRSWWCAMACGHWQRRVPLTSPSMPGSPPRFAEVVNPSARSIASIRSARLAVTPAPPVRQSVRRLSDQASHPDVTLLHGRFKRQPGPNNT